MGESITPPCVSPVSLTQKLPPGWAVVFAFAVFNCYPKASREDIEL